MIAYTRTNGSEKSVKREDRASENNILGYVVCSYVMKGN
jgi:hypothetical protein